MLHLADLRTHPYFEQARTIVENAGSDNVATFGGTHEQGYHAQQNPDEFAALLCYLLRRCRPIGRYGEIGVAAGGTTRLIHETIGFESAVLIDDAQHPKHRYFDGNVKNFVEKTTTIIGDSHSAEVTRLLADVQKNQELFDVVFIDGDHSYLGVMDDIRLIAPYCHPTTLLIFHDTVFCEGVRRAFNWQHRIAEFVNESKPLGIGIALAGENVEKYGQALHSIGDQTSGRVA